MALGAHLDIGSDGVAVITLENGKVNAMHPTGASTLAAETVMCLRSTRSVFLSDPDAASVADHAPVQICSPPGAVRQPKEVPDQSRSQGNRNYWGQRSVQRGIRYQQVPGRWGRRRPQRKCEQVVPGSCRDRT